MIFFSFRCNLIIIDLSPLCDCRFFWPMLRLTFIFPSNSAPVYCVLIHTSYVGPFWVWAVVKETITLATEQGALKQRILWRREDSNSCFLTEEAQMEAQVLLSAAITAARATARWQGWKGCRPAARTNSNTDCTITFTSLFRQRWRRVEMRARPLSQPTQDELTY